ncbi:DUF2849 domain-containing protein [Rhodospirillaceae bacterium SYSU D60014]|uniref:DUF2849 domain-containing protein n=1 Tax=Virgifigura deserti TaxID=2268457 RepID=UPI000E672B18
MTLKIITRNRLCDGVAVYLAADGGRSESVDEGRAVPTAEAGAPSVIEAAEEGCGRPARKADAPGETDAEPESTVCAAYWAY